MLPENIGARLRALREAKGMTKYRLGRIAKRRDGKPLGETYIYRIENGLIKHPRSDTLQSLATGLNIPLAQLIQETAPSDTWGLVEQSLKAYIPVYSGIGEGMEPIDYVASTRAKVRLDVVRAYRSNGFYFDPDIHSGDTLIVDTSLSPKDGDFAVVVIGGKAKVMRYRANGGNWFEDNEGRYEAEDVKVHGVVTDFQRKLR